MCCLDVWLGALVLEEDILNTHTPFKKVYLKFEMSWDIWQGYPSPVAHNVQMVSVVIMKVGLSTQTHLPHTVLNIVVLGCNFRLNYCFIIYWGRKSGS